MYSRPLKNPLAEALAGYIHDKMVWAAKVGGEPQPWRAGNSVAEQEARGCADDLFQSLPDYIELFRVIRKAGRSDAAKAKAVAKLLGQEVE